MNNLEIRRFTVINRVLYKGPFVYSVRWDDDPGQIFVTELHPRMFIPWPKNMPCPVPSSHPTRYEWTLDATGLEDVTAPEELVELVARTHGYVYHHSLKLLQTMKQLAAQQVLHPLVRARSLITEGNVRVRPMIMEENG